MEKKPLTYDNVGYSYDLHSNVSIFFDNGDVYTWEEITSLYSDIVKRYSDKKRVWIWRRIDSSLKGVRLHTKNRIHQAIKKYLSRYSQRIVHNYLFDVDIPSPRRGPYKGLSVHPSRRRGPVGAYTCCRREDKMGKEGTIPNFGYRLARRWWKRFYNKRNRANFKQRGKHLGDYYLED